MKTWFPALYGGRPSLFLRPPHPPDVGARKQEMSLKFDIPPFHRVSQYSGGEKSLLNTEGTTLNLACGELYGGCPFCAALSLFVMAIAN
ncbi:hypothetical protein H6G45_18445 [Synechocystis sp. FACHB-383]|uniref:hypothetical protein n=1 Tax=Synechocystis sp. FACHB-383 TaxID=2692864 RepID=UPI0016872355|nr:hypothetical protein [Synechocystis sp. FACHB-383]MBD2655421.1 hypothetical protein [Synechocystis sp. FACHB-383]